MKTPANSGKVTAFIQRFSGTAISLMILLAICSSGQAQTATRTAKELQLDRQVLGLSQVRSKLESTDRPIRVLAQVSRAALDPDGAKTEVLPIVGISAAQVSAATKSATEALRTSGAVDIRSLEGMPLLTFAIKASQLNDLAETGQFAIIVEDKLSKPYLGSSGPVIGVPELHAQGGTGEGHTLAILDTGVDVDHPFLNGRVVEGACYSSTFAEQGATSLCPGGASSSTTVASGNHCTGVDGCDHGTHVAGIAAGRAGGSISITGVAPDVNVMAVQVFSRFDDRPGGPNTCGSLGVSSPCVLSYDSDQIRGLQRVSDRAAVLNVIAANMSLGGGRFDSSCDTDNAALKAIIDQLLARDAVTVIAAGNDGYRTSIGSPGCISTAITVGSTTDSDAVSGFSNLSGTVDLLAPGSSIESSVPGTGFSVFNGTSMATPQVTGAFAAIASCAAPGTSVTDIAAALDETGVSVTDGRPSGTVTKSRIDLDAAGAAVGCGTSTVDVDCLPHNLANLRLKSSGWWFWRRWWIVDGNVQLFYFGNNRAEAAESLGVIQDFGFTSTCYIGRPDASMQYLRAGTSVPDAAHGSRDCIVFSPGGIRIEPTGGQWRLTDGRSSMRVFPNQAEAQQAVDAIRHHGLNRQCFVGRPDPSFTYWLAE